MVRNIVAFALIIFSFWGCKDELNKTGYDILLPGDLVSAHKDTIDPATIRSYTVKDDNLWTSRPELTLLGTYNDPVFGKTTNDFASQFRMVNYHNFEGVELDSLTLDLLYYETYGDTVTPQDFRVYELISALNAEDTMVYYQGENLKTLASTEVIGYNRHTPHLRLDSLTRNYGSTKEYPRDTVLQKIHFRLSDALARKLMDYKIGGNEENPNDRFIEYFKGLYVEAGDLGQGGSIMRIVPSGIEYSDSTKSTKTFLNSEMHLFYHKDTIKSVARYAIPSTAARVGRFQHNYESTDFYSNLDKLQDQDSLIYLQTSGGLASKIFINELNSWKDSTDCAINKAILVLKVDDAYSDTLLSPIPPKIILSLVKDSLGNIYDDPKTRTMIFPSDLSFSEAYFGGVYDEENKTYTFNLAKHLQEIVQGKKNYGFYLSTNEKNSIYRRVVLKGATSKAGIRFEITYTKIQ